MVSAAHAPTTQWANISKFHRVIPRDIYESLRYYEPVVLLEGERKSQVCCVVAEECLLLLKIDGFRQRAPEPLWLDSIVSVSGEEDTIDSFDGSVALTRPQYFLNNNVDKQCRRIHIGVRLVAQPRSAKKGNARKGTRGRGDGRGDGGGKGGGRGRVISSMLELVSWQKETRILFHIRRAWINYQTRVALAMPIAIALKGTSRAEAMKLFEEVQAEVLVCADARLKIELMRELFEAMLHDRAMKAIFLANSPLLQLCLGELLRGRSLAGRKGAATVSRQDHLELMSGYTQLVYAAIFNSEALGEARFQLLRPAPYSFDDLLAACTADFSAAGMARQKRPKTPNQRYKSG